MNYIYKYKFQTYDPRGVAIKSFVRLLDVQHQSGDDSETLTLWALIDEFGSSATTVRFRVFGTGEQVPENVEYYKTIQAVNCAWHLFKET